MTDRTVMTRVKADVSDFQRAMMAAKASVRGVREEINTTNDRTAWLAQGFMALAPAIAPLGAAAVPMLAGMTTQLLLTGAAAGTMLFAFNGLGDALDAVNEYQLEPTTENLEKMRDALTELGPAGAEFVRFLDGLQPQIDALQNVARQGMFPGFEDGIQALVDMGPQATKIVREISEAVGQLAAESGADLAGSEWEDFFNYLEDEAKPILLDMGRTLGNFAQAGANLLVGLSPATDDWSKGLLKFSENVAAATQNLDESQGFQDFLGYVHEMGPQVVDMLAAISMAILQLVEASAPIGKVLVPGLEALANVIGAVADTPLGTVFIALGAAVGVYGRAVALAEITTGRMGTTMFKQANEAKKARVAWADVGNAMLYSARSTTQIQGELAHAGETANKTLASQQKRALEARTAVVAYGKSIGPAVGQVALLGAATSGLADKVGLSNTATLALVGSMGGPYGAAAGAAAGAAMDFAAANDGLEDAIKASQRAVDDFDTTTMRQSLGLLEEQSVEVEKTATRWHDVLTLIPVAGTYLSKGSEKHFDSSLKAADAAKEETKAAIDAAAAQERYSSASQVSGRVSAITASQIRGMTAAMEEQNKTALASFDAITKYGKALDDAAAAAAKGKRGLDENTEGGRENRDMLSGLVAAWNDQGKAVANNVGKYQQAKSKLLELAGQMGASKKEARELAAALDLPKSIVTRYAFYDEEAITALQRIKRELASVPRSISTQYYVNQINSVNRRAAGGRDGDPSTPYDTGGYTGPGGHLEVAGIVHRNEVVLPEPIVKSDWAHIKARYGHLPGFADGGLVGGRNSASLDGLGGSGLAALILGLRDAIRASEKALRLETKERDQLSKKLDAEKDALDKLLDAQNELASGVQSGLAVDPLAPIPGSTNPWESGSSTKDRLPSFDEIIKTVVDATITAGAFTNAESYIGQYLTGGAFESVVASGNADLVNAFAKFTPAQLAEYQAKYDAMTGAQKGAGTTAGDIRYDAEIAAQAEVVGRLRDRLGRQEKRLRELERAVARYEKALEDARDVKKDRQDRNEKAKKDRKEKRDEQVEGDASSARGNRIAVDVSGDKGGGVAGLRRDFRSLAAAISGSQDRAADKIVAGVGDAFTKGTRAGVRRAK